MHKPSVKIQPQARQLQALSNPADIVVYGGAAGGGKTYALLLESLRNVDIPKFSAVIFRRTFPLIKVSGGLWDESQNLFPMAGGKPNASDMTWKFPRGGKVQFAHLQHDKNLQDWQGSQICLLCFDESTEFTSKQFWFLLSRNRSVCGIKPYARLTCNPDPESFLVCEEDGQYDTWGKGLISWWIDDDGFPIPERCGVVRWFVRVEGGKIVWADTKEQLEHIGIPLSITFIFAKLEDNPALVTKDPAYRGKLEALPAVDRSRLLGGNWKVRAEPGEMFPRDKWKYIDACPVGLVFARGWDQAATEGGQGARTGGPLLGYDDKNRWYVVDAVAERLGTDERQAIMKSTAELDQATYGDVPQIVEIEGGSGGKDQFLHTVRNLSGFEVHGIRPSGEKSVRWSPFSAQQRAGNVWIVKGDWNWTGYIRELDNLSGDRVKDRTKLRDLADGSALAFNWLNNARFGRFTGDILASGEDPIEHKRQSDEEVEQLPDFLRELVTEARKPWNER